MVEDRAADAEIEDGCVALAVARFRAGDIRDAFLIDDNLNDRMIELNAGQVPLLLEERDDAEADPRVLKLKDGNVRVGSRAMNRDSVHVEAQGRELDGIVLQIHARVEIFGGHALYF